MVKKKNHSDNGASFTTYGGLIASIGVLNNNF